MSVLNISALVILALSATCLSLIYGGYEALLRLVCILKRHGNDNALENSISAHEFQPAITIAIPVRDEEKIIESRLRNLIDTDYPLGRVEILVICDGCTDTTAATARKFALTHETVRIDVVEFTKNQGRASAQNEAYSRAKGEILIATDAETQFNRKTIPNLIAPFGNPLIGVTGGVIDYRAVEGKSIGKHYRKYRKMEQRLRRWETLLGILPKVDGPCVAYRKSIWTPIEEFEDVDQIITLLARKKGMIAVQAEGALCIDKANHSVAQEISQRSRMTRKALLSISNRWKPREILRHPSFSAALFAHKVLRYFSPLFLVLLTASTIILFYPYILWAYLFFMLCLLYPKARRFALSFFFAQLGFAFGVWKWLLGDKRGSYVSTHKIG